MKYLILIQSNARSLAAWDKMSDAERMRAARLTLSLPEQRYLESKAINAESAGPSRDGRNGPADPAP